MKHIYIIIVLTVLFSCTQNKKETNTSFVKAQDAIDVVKDSPEIGRKVLFNKVINETKIKSTPLKEATNFDSFIDPDDYKEVNVKALKLNELYPNFYKEGYNYSAIASYRIKMSKEFHTVVVTILKGDHEMESVSINYNLNGDIIDSKIISYDEIAESQSRIASKIESEKLTINNIFWADEKKVTTEIFEINIVGKIKPIISNSSDDVSLIDNVLEQLNLDKETIKTNLIVSKVQPNNKNETIVVIPEIYGVYDEGFFQLNSHIVLVDNTTKKITHKYFENYKTNGWVSDAVRLAEIKIDTAPYIVSENKRAFGIRIYYYNNSKPNPYSKETISLFLKSENSLKNVLPNYDVMNYGGEWDTNCDGEFIGVKSILIVSKEKTNDHFNILVKSKITETKNYEDKNGECDAKETVTNKTLVLNFNGEAYVKNGQ